MSIKQIENDIQYLVKTTKQQSVPPCDLTVSEWAVDWLDTFKSQKLRSSSLEKYSRTLKHIKNLFGDMMIAEFNILQAQKIFNTIGKPSVKDDCYALLFEMFEKAVKIRLIAFNPIKAIEITRHIKEHGKSFTMEQEQRFINACSFCTRGIAFIIGLYCGLRRGEILGLTADCIDLDNRVIHITKQCLDGNMTPPKTKSGVRDVPIFDDLYEWILCADLPKSGRLFPIKEHALREHFQNVLKACDLDGQGFSLHSLRHTFITRQAECGTARHLTQKWVGHSTADMTEQVYTHVNSDFESIEIENYNRRIKDIYNQKKSGH